MLAPTLDVPHTLVDLSMNTERMLKVVSGMAKSLIDNNKRCKRAGGFVRARWIASGGHICVEQFDPTSYVFLETLYNPL